MKILLLIDIQRDFCPGGALAVEQGDQVVGVANALMNSGKFDFIVASQDWHPESHSSFESLWPRHCVQNTPGAEFHPDLNQALIDIVVQKGTDLEIDSYSAFFDNNHSKQTELLTCLEKLAASRGETLDDIEITICGLATDYCVKFSALDARSLGFRTTVVLDGCRAVNINQDDELKALRQMVSAGVHVVESRSILEGHPVDLNPKSLPLHLSA